MHEEPQIPNFVDGKSSPRLRPGMTLAIEPMVNAGGPSVKMLNDGWTVVTQDGSLSAHFEHTVLITEAEPEVLTWPEKVLNDGQTIKPDILVVILILLLLFCAPASLAAKKRVHRFNRAEQDCRVCHQDAKHVGVSGLFTKECAVCHSDTDAASHSAHERRSALLR